MKYVHAVHFCNALALNDTTHRDMVQCDLDWEERDITRRHKRRAWGNNNMQYDRVDYNRDTIRRSMTGWNTVDFGSGGQLRAVHSVVVNLK